MTAEGPNLPEASSKGGSDASVDAVKSSMWAPSLSLPFIFRFSKMGRLLLSHQQYFNDLSCHLLLTQDLWHLQFKASEGQQDFA